MGRGHLGSFLRSPEVQVVAVSDVVAERRDDAKRMVETHYGREKKGKAINFMCPVGARLMRLKEAAARKVRAIRDQR
jgi:hypothetical protein